MTWWLHEEDEDNWQQIVDGARLILAAIGAGALLAVVVFAMVIDWDRVSFGPEITTAETPCGSCRKGGAK